MTLLTEPAPAGKKSSAPALELISVSKTFPGQKALSDVSLTIERGHVHALVGQNGSGKSTLIKVVAGFHDPDPGGEVRLAGTTIQRNAAVTAYRLGLRCVHQTLGLIEEFNAIENVALTCGYDRTRTGGIDWKHEAKRVLELLSSIGVVLDPFKPIKRCSAVERTAVAVARAIGDLDRSAGGMVLLDEPTAALAPGEVEHLFNIIDELTGNGISVMYVSHRLDEIFQIADRVSVLRGGLLVATRRVADIDHDELVELMIGTGVSVHRRGTSVSPSAPVVLKVKELVGQELDGVSFIVREGEVLGVAGLLGSGRSELPHLIAGKTTPFGGTMELSPRKADGQVEATSGDTPRRGHRRVSSLGSKRRRSAGRNAIVLVPSDRAGEGSVAEFSLRENITLGNMRRFSVGPRLVASRESSFARRWIHDLEIRPDDPERDFALFSGGNQQKVVLGKWLSLNPQVLVMDEPTIGVDIGAREKIYEVLRQQAARGLAIIASSSDTQELVEIADRVIVLKDGRIVADFEGAEITEQKLVRAMTLASETTGPRRRGPATGLPGGRGHADASLG